MDYGNDIDSKKLGEVMARAWDQALKDIMASIVPPISPKALKYPDECPCKIHSSRCEFHKDMYV